MQNRQFKIKIIYYNVSYLWLFDWQAGEINPESPFPPIRNGLCPIAEPAALAWLIQECSVEAMKSLDDFPSTEGDIDSSNMDGEAVK